MEMKAWAWLKAFPSFDNSQKNVSALATFYRKFAGYFSNLDFHVNPSSNLIIQRK